MWIRLNACDVKRRLRRIENRRLDPARGATNTDLGWTLGLRTELGLTDNWSFKAEALYFNLAKKSYDFGQFSGGVFEVKQKGFIANIGLNYRFNPFAPAPVLVAKY